MNTPQRTLSILQRIPAILAVTAASYGLAQPQLGGRGPGSTPVSGHHSPAPAQAQRQALRN